MDITQLNNLLEMIYLKQAKLRPWRQKEHISTPLKLLGALRLATSVALDSNVARSGADDPACDSISCNGESVSEPA